MSILKEFVQLQLEKIRSKGFNINVFKTFDDHDDLARYARLNLQRLGSGSSRGVYALTSKRVLKIALNDAGLAQNEAELATFTDPQVKPILAKIFDYDPKNRWLISELVRPAGYNEIEKHLGFENIYFEEFVATVAGGHGYDWLLQSGRYPEVEQHEELANALSYLVNEGDMLVADLESKSSWGFTADRRLVLLDAGATNEIYDTHYR